MEDKNQYIDMLSFLNGDFKITARLTENAIIISCVYKKDFREWIINVTEMRSEGGGKPIDAKNIYKIIANWIGGDSKTKCFFVVNLPNKLKNGSDPYI